MGTFYFSQQKPGLCFENQTHHFNTPWQVKTNSLDSIHFGRLFPEDLSHTRFYGILYFKLSRHKTKLSPSLLVFQQFCSLYTLSFAHNRIKHPQPYFYEVWKTEQVWILDQCWWMATEHLSLWGPQGIMSGESALKAHYKLQPTRWAVRTLGPSIHSD